MWSTALLQILPDVHQAFITFHCVFWNQSHESFFKAAGLTCFLHQTKLCRDHDGSQSSNPSLSKVQFARWGDLSKPSLLPTICEDLWWLHSSPHPLEVNCIDQLALFLNLLSLSIGGNLCAIASKFMQSPLHGIAPGTDPKFRDPDSSGFSPFTRDIPLPFSASAISWTAKGFTVVRAPNPKHINLMFQGHSTLSRHSYLQCVIGDIEVMTDDFHHFRPFSPTPSKDPDARLGFRFRLWKVEGLCSVPSFLLQICSICSGVSAGAGPAMINGSRLIR